MARNQTPAQQPKIEAEQYRVYYLGDGQPMMGYSCRYEGDPQWHPIPDPIAITVEDMLGIAAQITRRDGRPFSFTPVQYSGFGARHIIAGNVDFTIAERFFWHLDQIKQAMRDGTPPPAKHELQRRGQVTPTTVDPRARLRMQAATQQAAASAAPAPQAAPARPARQRAPRPSVAQQTMG